MNNRRRLRGRGIEMAGSGLHAKMASEGKEREAICDLPGVRGAGRRKVSCG